MFQGKVQPSLGVPHPRVKEPSWRLQPHPSPAEHVQGLGAQGGWGPWNKGLSVIPVRAGPKATEPGGRWQPHLVALRCFQRGSEQSPEPQAPTELAGLRSWILSCHLLATWPRPAVTPL